MENHICPDRTDIQITYDYTWTNLYLNKIASDIKYLLNAGDKVTIKLADSVNCDELIITCSKGSIPLTKNSDNVWEGTIPTEWNSQETFSVIMVIKGSKGLLYQGLLNQYDSFQSVEDEGYYVNSISQVGSKINAVSKKFDDEIKDNSINAPQTKIIKSYVDTETNRAKDAENQLFNDLEQAQEGIDEALNNLKDYTDDCLLNLDTKINQDYANLNTHLNTEITNRKLLAGHSIKISQAKEHIIDIDLINANGSSISHQEINLDSEHIIDKVTLDYVNKKLVFTFKDGHSLNCDISSMIDDLNTKLTKETTRATTKETELENSINKVNTKIDNLDYSSSNTTDKTIVSLTQTDGKINATYKNIQITQYQVNDLVNDLESIKLNISTESADRKDADNSLQEEVDTINSKIPSQASNTNQLADKEFVNSSISTATATFRGTFTSKDELKSLTGDLNDYAYIKVIDTITGLVKQYDKYKYSSTTSTDTGNWTFEYTLNNSSFTEEQWKALNSGVTNLLVEKISTNEENISSHISNKSNPHGVTKAQIGLENVDNTNDLSKPISTATQTALNEKQDTLTAGTNISLEDNTISVTDTTDIAMEELSTSQLNALNSGITKELVDKLNNLPAIDTTNLIIYTED